MCIRVCFYSTSRALGVEDVDGDVDLVVGVAPKRVQSLLYLNNGTGTFTDATASRLPVGTYFTTSLALGDVVGYGDLVLVVGYGELLGQQNRLYLNNGTGTFTDATASRMPAGSAATRALGDGVGDGDHDVVVGGSQPSRHYLKHGTRPLTGATATRKPADT